MHGDAGFIHFGKPQRAEIGQFAAELRAKTGRKAMPRDGFRIDPAHQRRERRNAPQGRRCALRVSFDEDIAGVRGAGIVLYHLLTIFGHHRVSQQFEARIMAYLLPRAVIVLIAWGMIVRCDQEVMARADPAIFGVAGACWIAGGTAYFGYLHKLRRDIEALERDARLSTALPDKSAATSDAGSRIVRLECRHAMAEDVKPPARFQPRARLP